MWSLVSFLCGARYPMHEPLPLSYILRFSFCESMALLHNAGSPQILRFSNSPASASGVLELHMCHDPFITRWPRSAIGECAHTTYSQDLSPRASVIKCFCLIVLVGFFLFVSKMIPQESSKIHKGESVYNFIVNKVDVT